MMIEIDGATLEGGGQIIRNAFTLSALTGTAIKIRNIRANRDKPGLKEQHLRGIQLVQQLSHGQLKGAEHTSTSVEFTPGRINAGSYEAIVHTAGSVALLLQISLPCILFAQGPVDLVLEGGTNVEMAPQIEYMTEVFRYNLEKMGASFNFDVKRRGYFPKGGGRVAIHTNPIDSLKPLVLDDFGDLKSINGWSFVAGRVPPRVANEMADGAKHTLKETKIIANIEAYKEANHVAPIGNAAGIVLVAETTTGCFLGGSALQKRNESPFDVGIRAGRQLLDDITEKSCLDKYCQDQVIIFMALATGKSRVRVGSISLHTKTAIFVAETLTQAKFAITPNGNSNIIECQGIGFKRGNVTSTYHKVLLPAAQFNSCSEVQ